jgi:hypothetical protein
MKQQGQIMSADRQDYLASSEGRPSCCNRSDAKRPSNSAGWSAAFRQTASSQTAMKRRSPVSQQCKE